MNRLFIQRIKDMVLKSKFYNYMIWISLIVLLLSNIFSAIIDKSYDHKPYQEYFTTENISYKELINQMIFIIRSNPSMLNNPVGNIQHRTLSNYTLGNYHSSFILYADDYLINFEISGCTPFPVMLKSVRHIKRYSPEICRFQEILEQMAFQGPSIRDDVIFEHNILDKLSKSFHRNYIMSYGFNYARLVTRYEFYIAVIMLCLLTLLSRKSG